MHEPGEYSLRLQTAREYAKRPLENILPHLDRIFSEKVPTPVILYDLLTRSREKLSLPVFKDLVERSFKIPRDMDPEGHLVALIRQKAGAYGNEEYQAILKSIEDSRTRQGSICPTTIQQIKTLIYYIGP